MGETILGRNDPEVRPAAAKAGDYRAHQTTGGRLAAPDMSDQPRHRMAGDYRTGSAAAPLELPPATGSSRKSRRFQASSTTPARSSRRGAGMVPSRHQPANVNLMGMEQLKLFKRALEVGDMNKYALRVSSPINPNRSSFDGTAARNINREQIGWGQPRVPRKSPQRLTCWGSLVGGEPPKQPDRHGNTSGSLSDTNPNTLGGPCYDPRRKLAVDAVINLASFPGSATSMHQTDYAWSHGALSDKKRDSLVALYPERRSKRPNSLVEYSDGCCLNRVGMYNRGMYAHDYRPNIQKVWPWLAA